MTRESLVVSTLVELADNLVDNYDVIDVLTTLCNRCVEAIDADAVGVMLALPGGDLQFMAASSEAMTVLEVFQIQVNEGPCVDCYSSGVAIVNRELVNPDEQWPQFTPLALSKGFKSVHCVPLRLRGRTIGALNFFRNEQGLLTDADIIVAQGIADIATIAILQHRTSLDARVLNDQLSFALNSRIVIEQAKGMVSQSANCDMDVAFARLRVHARNHNLRLTEVAVAVIASTIPIEVLDNVGGTESRPKL